MPKVPKKTDYPTFSCGTDAMWWFEHNCDVCIKAEHPIVQGKRVVGYANKGRCKVNSELLDSAVTGGVTLRVHRIIADLKPCRFLKSEWDKRKRKVKDDYPTLFEDHG